MKSLFVVLLFICLTPNFSHAQRIGKFDTTLAFGGTNRAISYYVPTSYTPSNKYRLMICLHGLGDTCSNYRDALISGLGWATNIPNTIFVAPEAVNKSADFFDGLGGEQIIQKSIEMASALYHIDTANIILQGFSLGGRAALRYGLDHYTVFKGLLLNTPAIQGVKEALNGHAAIYSFDYSKGNNIPIYVTHGANDIAYGSSIDSTLEQLIIQDSKIYLRRITGLGHSIPPYPAMANFLQFFEQPAHSGLDLEVSRIHPLNTTNCTLPAPSKILIRNNGQTTITAASLSISNGSASQKVSWSGSLAPFQHAWLYPGINTLADGTQTLTVSVDSLNNQIADSISLNNTAANTFYYNSHAQNGLDEGFEGTTFPPANWTLQKGGDFYSAWDMDDIVFKSGVQSAATFNTILIFDNLGREEGLITPLVALPSNQPRLSFDIAYNYHEYTPPYISPTMDFADTLEILVSTDCGTHYTTIFKKGGKDLATFSTPILNPLSIEDCFTNPTASDWRTEKIDLSNFVSGGPVNALVKFNYISALGGSINIDNVKIASATQVPSNNANSIKVYPNPGSDVIKIDLPFESGGVQFQLFDPQGKLILANALETTPGKNIINTQTVAEGVYYYKIRNSAGIIQQGKWVKVR
ncbi:MAG: T9SS type A sorting domain-containing protein [Bacteroidetes bacterium]|nr:T9SS type A sorting domain-containing protein [Bacteroidota bacterium]